MKQLPVLVLSMLLMTPALPYAQEVGAHASSGMASLFGDDERYNQSLIQWGIGADVDLNPWLTAGIEVQHIRTSRTDIQYIPLNWGDWRDRNHTSIGATLWAGRRLPFWGTTTYKLGPVLGAHVRRRSDNLHTRFIGVYHPDQELEDAEADAIEAQFRSEMGDNENETLHRFTYTRPDEPTTGEWTGVAVTEEASATEIGVLAGFQFEVDVGAIAVGSRLAYRYFPGENDTPFQADALDLALRLGYRF